jgi:hypothetical protein
VFAFHALRIQSSIFKKHSYLLILLQLSFKSRIRIDVTLAFAHIAAQAWHERKHTAVESETSKHTAVESETSKHTAVESETSKHTAVESETSKHTAVESETSKHTAVESETSKHTAVESETSKHTAVESETSAHSVAWSASICFVAMTYAITMLADLQACW